MESWGKGIVVPFEENTKGEKEKLLEDEQKQSGQKKKGGDWTSRRL